MRLLRRLRGERGLALPMALGIMFVLTISTTAAIYYTTTNSRSASRSKADQTAFALAEAGINNAMAVLANPSNNAMTTTLLPARTTAYDGGSVTWSGTLDSNTATWALKATGAVRSPTNASDVTSTIKASVFVKSRETQPRQNDAWNYVFVTRTGNTCDFSVTPGSTWDTPLYAFGNVCLTQGSKIVGAGPVTVRQKITMNGNPAPFIGTTASPLTRVEVGIGCKYLTQHLHPDADGHPFCSSVDRVWATTYSNTPTVIDSPTVYWDQWYANAIPGPKFACSYTEGTPPTFDNDGVRNTSVVGTTNITPAGLSYKCRVGPDFSPSSPPYSVEPIGELSWNHTTNSLRVHGTVFFDGSISIMAPTTTPIAFDGHGSIYTSGSFTLSGTSTRLCAVVSGSDCNYTWNRDAESLTIVAAGTITTANQSRMQANLYSGTRITLGADSKHEGAVVTPELSMGSGSVIDPFSTITTVPTGTPGTTPVYGEPQPPTGFTS
ncbi:MAG: hypothetical protein M3321_07035 [Actinomycetota bacterium]|nr:hypothetical protein [Actinomycetota bacterium]